MSDYYRTIGFQRDKAQLLSALNRIAAALERIADRLDPKGFRFPGDEDDTDAPF